MIDNQYNQLIEQTYFELFHKSFENCSQAKVIQHIRGYYNNEQSRIALRLWLDPFYRLLFEDTRSFQACLDAGYFDDGSWESVFGNLDYVASQLLTPLQIIIDNLRKVPSNSTKPHAVILTTGCFAPVHVGHFEMMEKAKSAVELAGYHVLGGYMSPSHDSYVNTKDNGNARMNIMKRIQILELAAVNSGWIQIDPWEGVYNSISINFTDVVGYLQNYLDYHLNLDQPIEVFYVFGADNSHFAKVFQYSGKCVILSRYGYEIPKFDNPNILISNSSSKRAISSTAIRKGYYEFLPTEVLEIYRNSVAIDKHRNAINIALRKDSLHSLKDWYLRQDCPDIGTIYDMQFRLQLKKLLTQAFESKATTVYDVNYAQQRAFVKNLKKQGKGYVVSLDPLCPISNNIRLSRLFPISGNQLKRIETVVSHVKMYSSKQSTHCFIVDDDIVSGKTMEFVQSKYISQHLTVTQISLLPYGLPKDHASLVFDEILDERDFLIGSKDGGLLCLLPNGQHARAPYILPFVNPIWRASMDAENVVNFSCEVWKLNMNFYSIYNTLTVNDSDLLSQNLFYYLGYNQETTLLEIANNYYNLL